MAYTNLCCLNGGSNLNAGSRTGDTTVPGTAASFTYAGGSWVAATGIFTVVTGNPLSDGVAVGDFASVYLTAGAVSTGFVGRVTARAASTLTISLTARMGSAPADGALSMTCKVGGAWQGPNGTDGFPWNLTNLNACTNSAGNPVRFNMKNDQTYSPTAAITQTVQCVTEGFTTAYGDGGMATISGSTGVAGYVALTISSATGEYRNLIFANNGNSGSSNLVTVSNTRNRFYNCVFHDCRGFGLDCAGNQNYVEKCEFYLCNQSNTASTGGFRAGGLSVVTNCIAHDNTGSNSSGFINGSSGCSLTGCVFDTNGGTGVTSAQSALLLNQCAFYSNVSHGVSNTGGVFECRNSVFISNGTGGTGYGISDTITSLWEEVVNCAFFGNATGDMVAAGAAVSSQRSGTITLTGDPFTAAATGNFTLNNTASAGAACRGAGMGSFTQTQASYTGTTSYPDVGAAQHLETIVAAFSPVGRIVG